jgi:hypothetical protein
VITVVIQTRTVFNRRCDPDGAETQIMNIVEALDQPFEIATPMRINSFAVGVEANAVAAEEVIRWVTIVEASCEQKIDGLFAEIRSFFDWTQGQSCDGGFGTCGPVR